MESSSNNTAEESKQKQPSSGPTLSAGEAFIQIDSISIDLPNVNSKNEKTPNCEHFSIRKYVFGMRQKDKKACWPFESEKKNGSADLEPKYPLPSLDMPKFRWWQCRNCLQRICEKENGKSVLVDDLNGECNSDSPSHAHMALAGSETLVLASDGSNGAEKSKADADRLVQETANESHALISADQIEERNDESNATIKVPENVLDDNAYIKPPGTTSNATELKESHGKEKEADEAVGRRSISADPEVNGVVNSPRNPKLQRDASDDRTSLTAVNGVNRGYDNPSVKRNGHPSDDLDCPSSDSAEVGPGYRSRDKPGALRRRKVRKVRLLSDLLGLNLNMNMNGLDQEEPPLPAISDESEDFGPRMRKPKRKFCLEDVDSDKEANEVETVTGNIGENRKGKAGTVEAGAFARTSFGLVTNVKKKKKNEEESVQYGVREAVVAGEMENDSYFLKGSTDSSKFSLTRHIDDGNLRVLTKKKKKRSERTEVSFQDKLGESRRNVDFNFSPTSCNHDGSRGREAGSSSSSLLKMENSSCMCKKKSKMPQEYDGHIARMPQSSGSNKLGEDSVSRVKFGLVQSSSPTAARFLPDGNGNVKKGDDFSSFRGKAEAKHPISLDYVLGSTIPWQQVGPEEGRVHKKNVVSARMELKVPSRSRPDGFFEKRGPQIHKSKEPGFRMPFPDGRQRYVSRFEDIGHFLMPRKEITHASSQGETTGFQEQPTVTKNQSNRKPDKSSAQRTCSDDIPMEIVEVMANLQYDNSLHDSVKDRSKSDTRKSPIYQNPRISREYRNGDLNFLQKEGAVGERITPKHVKKLHSAKPKPVDVNYPPYTNLNSQITTRVEQNQNPFKGHGLLFPQYREKTGGNKRNEDNTVGALLACNTCHVAGTGEEPFRLWPSSSTIPFAQTNVPRNGTLQPSELKSSGLKRKNKPEPNRGFVMESSKRENIYAPRPNGVKGQVPLGSSDFYSNEKIPALHLLSLMDARSSHNGNANPRLAKQSPPIPKELDFGAYKAAETFRHPPTIDFMASARHDQLPSPVQIMGSPPLFGFHENVGNGVTGQVPLKVREKGKMKKCSNQVVGSFGGFGSQKYATPGFVPVHNQQKNEFVGASSSALFASRFHRADNSEKEQLRSTTTGSVWPPRSSLEMGICTMNRNPAEFSIPEAGNMYTIRGSELRFGKRVSALDRPRVSIGDLNRPKRGRKKKSAVVECQQVDTQQYQIP